MHFNARSSRGAFAQLEARARKVSTSLTVSGHAMYQIKGRARVSQLQGEHVLTRGGSAHISFSKSSSGNVSVYCPCSWCLIYPPDDLWTVMHTPVKFSKQTATGQFESGLRTIARTRPTFPRDPSISLYYSSSNYRRNSLAKQFCSREDYFTR